LFPDVVNHKDIESKQDIPNEISWYAEKKYSHRSVDQG
jgi:hypothetical protein